MENRNPSEQASPTFRDLYPALTKRELEDAEANFRGYLEIVFQIHEELPSTGGDFDSFQISSTVNERSNSSLTN